MSIYRGMDKETQMSTAKPVTPAKPSKKSGEAEPGKVREVGGPSGPEPTRYGDWERGGRCVDF